MKLKFWTRCPCQGKTNQGTSPLEGILQLYRGSDNTDKDTKGSFVLWPETVIWFLLTFVLGLSELENPSYWTAIKSSVWNQWEAWPPCSQSQASPMRGFVVSPRIWVINSGNAFAGAVQGTVINLMFCWMKQNIWLAFKHERLPYENAQVIQICIIVCTEMFTSPLSIIDKKKKKYYHHVLGHVNILFIYSFHIENFILSVTGWLEDFHAVIRLTLIHISNNLFQQMASLSHFICKKAAKPCFS